jgi:cysteinyl-tRNA synthetase
MSGTPPSSADPRLGPVRPRLHPVRIFDTLRGELVSLEPLVPPRVGLFVCGLTPYKPSHIGHARSFVFFDLVARFLRYVGYRVFYVQNVTDVDDKLIRQAHEEGGDIFTVSERNFRAYLRDMDRLGVRSVNLYARCTDYMPEILRQVQDLLDRGFAYQVDGDVYFEVSRFPRFGALSRQRREDLLAGARVEVDPRKRAPEDFALWKSAKPGEPWWESPWGPGRPGWHIEDTAITVNVLGPRYDIHGGGAELKFPHHEAEIAQAESATGQSPLASIWMHAGLLLMQGEKMSKSLGNVLDLSEALREVRPEVLRYFLLSGLYRSPLEFQGPASWQEAEKAHRSLTAPWHRINELLGDLDEGDEASAGTVSPWTAEATRVRDSVVAALSEDFNIREATAALFGWSRRVQSILSGSPEPRRREDLLTLRAPYDLAQEVLGYLTLDPAPPVRSPPAELTELVELLVRLRQEARQRGDYAQADRIRTELAERGISLEDGPGGTRWSARGRDRR